MRTTLCDIAMFQFSQVKTHIVHRHWGKAISNGNISLGLSHQNFQQYIPKTIHIIQNKTKGARSSERAYEHQICLTLLGQNTYEGVHKVNVLTTTCDNLWSFIIHRTRCLKNHSRKNKWIYSHYNKRSVWKMMYLLWDSSSNKLHTGGLVDNALLYMFTNTASDVSGLIFKFRLAFQPITPL